MDKRYIIDRDNRFYVNLPISMLFSIAAGAVTYYIYGFGITWIARTLACVVLFLILQSDKVHKKIPRPYTNVLFLAALMDMFGGMVPIKERVLWFLICMVPLYVLVFSNPKAVGGGDMRVISYMALFFGRDILTMLFASIVLAFLHVLVGMLFIKGRDRRVPMGGYLAICSYVLFILDCIR